MAKLYPISTAHNHDEIYAKKSEAGVTDHGALTGLEDNDHPQYRLVADAIDHGALTGLSDNDHPQYALKTLENTWTNTEVYYDAAPYKTHFNTSSPSDFTWSATPRNKGIYSNTWLAFNTNSPSNILLYKALGTGKFVLSAGTYFAIDSNSIQAGLRLDDGTDTNVLRFWLESTATMAGCKLWCTSKIAGTETTIALSPIMCYGTPVTVRVYRETSAGTLYYYVHREPILRSTYTGDLTSLPNYTRASIYAVSPTSQSRNAYFDFFYVDERAA